MIEIARVSKRFVENKKEILAVEDFSAHIKKGEVVGLVGENGAGKTTLLRMIATLLEATSGEILLDGLNTKTAPMQIKHRIGVLFGGETGLYTRLTARENLEYFAMLYGLSRHETKVRIESLAVQFGMKPFMDRKVAGFSRGMRQKVAIARALIHDPDILIFDEPTTGLDITSANIFRQLIHQLKREGKTIIFSSHMMEEIQMLCQSVILLHKGRLIYYGDLQTLYEEEGSQDLNFIFMSRLVRGSE